MNEGVGSTPIIVIIVVFIAIVSGYMAYNVNYTKAFRMKNKIISVYEHYDGVCDSSCRKEIDDYADEIGYHVDAGFNETDCDKSFFKPEGSYVRVQYHKIGKRGQGGFCEYKVKVPKVADDTNLDVIDDTRDKYYYRIITRIDINIPIITNVFDLRFLNVTGDTKALEDYGP